MADTYDLLFLNRHPELKRKDDNWTLIYNSYIGGVAFNEGGYLIKYPKESQRSFEIRKKRAVYFNQVSPVVDMLSGLLFLNAPTRKIPAELNYIFDDISYGKKIDEFMRIVAAHSFMFTCGILVDSPSFDPNEVKTQKDIKDKNIHPYSVLYLPFRIRDFNININDGELDWVLLDNSYYEHTNPFAQGKEIIRYTLWTREYHQDFEKTDLKSAAVPGEVKNHDLGKVPFRFVSWRDDNNDFVSETVCEDIAMISKLIYNNLSYMDEMLASGTFKMLAYPSRDGDIPEALKSGGVGPLGVIPYEIDSSTQPAFIGASLSDIDPFVKAIEFYMSEVLKKVGLSTDETKEFVKSGAAKKIDFQKMRALLISGALMMGKLETWICEISALWQKKSLESKVEYTSAFSDEDLQTEVTMLTELLVHPIKKLKINVMNLIVKKLLANNLKPEVLEEIYADIEKSLTADVTEGQASATKTNVQDAANKIKSSQKGTPGSADPKKN
jgi:hypothetical protein